MRRGDEGAKAFARPEVGPSQTTSHSALEQAQLAIDRRSADQLAVKREIAIGHVIDGEASRDGCAACGTVDLADAGDGFDGAVETVDEKARDAVIDKLGHGAAIA